MLTVDDKTEGSSNSVLLSLRHAQCIHSIHPGLSALPPKDTEARDKQRVCLDAHGTSCAVN